MWQIHETSFWRMSNPVIKAISSGGIVLQRRNMLNGTVTNLFSSKTKRRGNKKGLWRKRFLNSSKVLSTFSCCPIWDVGFPSEELMHSKDCTMTTNRYMFPKRIIPLPLKISTSQVMEAEKFVVSMYIISMWYLAVFW